MSVYFRSIRELLSPLGMNEVALNKKSPSSYSYHEAKGVESDHIKIFKVNELKSFAFAFYFEGVQDPLVHATTKESEEIISSIYSREQFKEKMKGFISLLKILKDSKNLTKESAFSTFKSVFMKTENKFEPEKKAKEIVAKIIPKIESLEKEYETEIKKHKKLDALVKENKKSVEAVVAEKSKELGLEELRNKFHKALDKVEAARKKAEKDLEVEENQRALWRSQSNLYSFNKKVDELVQEETAGFPKSCRDIVTKSVSNKKVSR